MPIFEFTSPDGKKYEVEGPAGSTPEQAFQQLQGHLQSVDEGQQRFAAGSSALRKSEARFDNSYLNFDIPGKGKVDQVLGENPATSAVLGVAAPLGRRLVQSLGPQASAVVGAKHAWDRAAAGIEGAFRHVAPMFPDGFNVSPELDPETQRRLTQGAEAVKERGIPAVVGQIAGDVMMSAAPVGKLQAAVRAPTLVKAMGRMAPVAALGTDIAANAGYAALTAPENRGEAALWGGGGAAAGRVLAKALGQVPMVDRERLKTLTDAGVNPTVGQAVRTGDTLGSRILARAEDTLADVPVVGAPVRMARERALNEWQAGVRNNVLEAGNLDLPPGTKFESIKDVGVFLRGKYEGLINGLTDSGLRISPKLPGFDSKDTLTFAQKQQVLKMVNSTVDALVGDAQGLRQITPKQAHEIGKRLLSNAQRYKASTDPRIQDIGYALERQAQKFRENFRGALPADKRKELESLDKAWQQYAPVREIAAKGDVADPSNFNPVQLLRSIRAGDRSPNKSRYIELSGSSEGLPQHELAKAGQMTIGSPSKDAGWLEKAVGIGGLALGAYSNLPATAALTMLGFGAYTPPGQNALRGAVSVGQTFGEFMESNPELASQIARSIATQTQD